MAIALIGGMVTSTILNLVTLPALYEIGEGLHDRAMQQWSQWRNRAVDEKGTPISAADQRIAIGKDALRQ